MIVDMICMIARHDLMLRIALWHDRDALGITRAAFAIACCTDRDASGIDNSVFATPPPLSLQRPAADAFLRVGYGNARREGATTKGVGVSMGSPGFAAGRPAAALTARSSRGDRGSVRRRSNHLSCNKMDTTQRITGEGRAVPAEHRARAASDVSEPRSERGAGDLNRPCAPCR